MVQHNWAELKFGKRLKKWAKRARDRIRKKHPELEAEHRSRERKDVVWHTLTEASYSKLAWTVGMFLATCIALSVVAFILETVPAYEQAPGWGDRFFYAECFFVVVFTIEIALKFWSTPETTMQFFSDGLNVIDILSIMPFYLELFLVLVVGGQKIAVWDLRALRALRLARMLKMGRFSSDLQLLAAGLMRARMSIALLCGTLLLGTVMFSVIMWVVERGNWNPAKQCYSRPDEAFFNGCSPFESVPVGFWWAITTMTTVGYGDSFPLTGVGRVIGGLAMLAGIFCVALPTGILCTEFTKLYEDRRKECQIPHEQGLTEELSMRSKAELELLVAGDELATSRSDLEAQLAYVKRLAYLYADMAKHATSKTDYEKNKFKKGLKTVDPLYNTFQNQAMESLDTLRGIVIAVSAELGRARTYTGALSGRGSFSGRGRSSSRLE